MGSSGPIPRPGARALVLDAADRLLLLRYPTVDDPGVWLTPGGALEPGESDEDALRRELREELHLEAELGPWVWTRRHVWEWNGTVYETIERIAVVRVDASEVTPDPSDSLFFGGVEQGFQWRWWTLGDLERTPDRTSPRRLATFLRELLENGPPDTPLDVGR